MSVIEGFRTGRGLLVVTVDLSGDANRDVECTSVVVARTGPVIATLFASNAVGRLYGLHKRTLGGCAASGVRQADGRL
jgi:hypothetical protein